MENMAGLKNKIVLVTGGYGFVGSHVVEYLLKNNYQVIIPYRSIDYKSYFWLNKLNQKVILAQGDLKDKERIFEIINKYDIEYIIHLGAQSIVTTAYNNPGDTIATNVIGTTNILEAARLFKSVKGVIVASSDKAYGKSIKPYKESDPLSGDHPYEVSKSAADLISQTYIKTYNLPVIITRFGNIYGPGDMNRSRIIPAIVNSSLSKTRLELRSDGTFVRDYIYVEDVASAYLFLLNNFQKLKGEAYNISGSDTLSVIDLINIFKTNFDKKLKYEIKNTAINEISYQHLITKKINKVGWKAKYDIFSGLAKTLYWYQKNSGI
jgi:CDP-glucose 4,6-dehydratase